MLFWLCPGHNSMRWLWVQMDDHVPFSGTKYAKGNNTYRGNHLNVQKGTTLTEPHVCDIGISWIYKTHSTPEFSRPITLFLVPLFLNYAKFFLRFFHQGKTADFHTLGYETIFLQKSNFFHTQKVLFHTLENCFIPSKKWKLFDDRPFIVLTETKFSFRCIPVWIGTLL